MAVDIYRELAETPVTNSRVHEIRRRANINYTVDQAVAAISELQQQTQTITEFIGGDPDIGVLQDDGVPPAAPTGVVVTPVPYKELDVTWNTPPSSDGVMKAVIEFTPTGSSAFQVDGTPDYGYANDLSSVQHSVRVKFVDIWGHESAWSSTVTATPMLTAAEQVDLAGLAILGRLQGLLPQANLSTITDAAKLGSGVVTAAAMATQDLVALNAWIQDAAIDTAKIKQLAVDKLISGTIATAQITINASGKLICGMTQLDANGMYMAPTGNLDDTASGASYRISTTAPSGQRFAHLHFYTEEGTAFHRGLVLRADGTSTNTVQGLVEIHAVPTYNATPYTSQAAVISIKSRPHAGGQGEVLCWPFLNVTKGDSSGDGIINSDGQIFSSQDIGANTSLWCNLQMDSDSITPRGVAALGSVGPGVTRTWTTNWGQWPILIEAFEDRGNGTRKQLPWGTDYRVESYSVNNIQIYNASAGSTFTAGYLAHKRF